MDVEIVENVSEFKKRDKHSVWIFRLEREYRRETDFKGIPFASLWLDIFDDGTFRIATGYAWNGCTPKFSLFDLIILGTPDGIVDVEMLQPKLYYPTLVHDALYQYYAWHQLTRKQVDDLFLKMMREVKFKPAWLYYAVVRLLGWVGMPKKHPLHSDLSFEAV